MRAVYFDLLFAQPMDGTKYHGGGEYMKSVFAALVEDYYTTTDIHVLYNFSEFIDEWVIRLIEDKNISKHNVNSAHAIAQVLQNVQDKQNTKFFTGMIYQYAGVILPQEMIKIGVCHGLRPIEKLYDYEQWRYLKSAHEWKEYLRSIVRDKHAKAMLEVHFSNILKSFNVIITDSQFSAYSIKSNLCVNQKETQLHVYYAPHKHMELNEDKEDGIARENYIMMINANRWLKNSYRGVMALDELYERNLVDIKTKVYGNLPLKIFKKIKHKEMFELMGYVSSQELEEAYSNCRVFFYPTLNEGFGLPPLEAMKYGKTCVISAVCSLPEVYGDSVYYCNPYDCGEMTNRILLALENPITESKIREKVHEISERQKKDLEKLCALIAK